ncbi:hypothetical protein NA57DRAFT_57637 [Rhizodiscina lignyota]|uniref:Cyclin-D1-binding protein 1-like N-terminal domain-containing protein n=1 Tax=Rhizodiscina lignyota TaxID=1504668 RepID=A0A9P4IC79_9PEZI|nr:hypothetical protein NA57DRAFT_57637 [Rhizodiscina lignyota]
MPPPAPTSSALPALLESTHHLLARFQSLLLNSSASTASQSQSPESSSTSPPNPLSVLADAAKLLKAHTTKLGLLLLNKPFTPSAVVKVLSEITGTCLPAMMGAIELLNTPSGVCWGSCVEKHVKSKVNAVLGAVGELVKDIERVAKGEDAARTQKQSDSTLASTGQVWSTCDALVTISATSPADIVIKKAEEYRSLLRDAIDELKEWAEEEDEGYDDEEVSDQDSDVQFGPSKCPTNKPELRAQVEGAVKKLKLVEMGYKALGKRRLKTFPFEDVGRPNGQTDETVKAQAGVKKLDEVMDLLKRIPEDVDELAGKFYELDEKGAVVQLQKCCDSAINAVVLVKNGWDDSPEPGQDRAFADWVDKWIPLLRSG